MRTTTTRALGAGDGAVDEQVALLGVDAPDLEVLDRALDVPHATSHAQALEDASGGGAGADGAGLAVVAVGTVGGGDTSEAVTLHDAREALALGGAGDVDELADLEGVGREFLAGLVLAGQGGTDLGDVAAGGDAGLVEVALEGLGELALVDLAVGQLEGLVAVVLDGADLGDDVLVDLDDGYGDAGARSRPRPASFRAWCRAAPSGRGGR